jgi:hypothetical protein
MRYHAGLLRHADSLDHHDGERAPCRHPERHRHCPGLWRGQFTIGYGEDGRRERRKVSGRTKTAVVDKLRALHGELDHGLVPKTGYANYNGTCRQRGRWHQ